MTMSEPTPRHAAISRRRLLAAAGGLALAAPLAACGSNTGRGGGGPGGGTVLRQWYHQYGEPGTQSAVKRYAAAYRQAEVTVEWRPGDYDRQTAAALLTADGPDVFEANGPTLDQIRGGQVADLTAEIAAARDDFNPAVLAPKIYGGRVWGIPQTIDTQLLYYRKSLLAKAGVAPPATLDALVTAARALTGKDVKGLFLGNDGGAGVLGSGGIPLIAAGLDLLTADGRAAFADPAGADALARLRTLWTDKSLLLGAPADWSDPSAFVQGLTAMQWTGLWALPQIAKALGDDFGVLPFPAAGAHGKPAVPVGAYAAAVNARSKHRDAAKRYVKWLWVDRTDFQEDFALSYGFHIPARLSLARKAAKLRTGPAADAVRYATGNGHAAPLLWTPGAQTAVQDAFSRIIKDGADPRAQLASAASRVTAEVRRARGEG
ncbi:MULTISPECIES: ABC transporter substrate-binding protein [Streptomycetaceae]|uniref:Extracellular solute-binding protein family 1 n=1 Tax=Streptantibioticus cattleyicolor (strain ATCC 35852 / DSM 46488 / JCM 4925 / NBRC 14057 / NRRL 8057) TaxID=1003195 RepID=F8JNY4_STREN|nr:MULTISPECIES: extracellular solute-binding protein [Streptomycetaceae]AEW93925.1 extracellular solute-binding protein family 1 [Streptantibioticus cattleyicolor NRRL 8057 = DSM 46488]MYS58601.1 extracellular solute-binding protein [Streptomyces sp. SID5468]CCB74271.1 Carbohydrate ABC transporter substrate-binding protein, CUT1 family [Streptantibioticus cattleyicolor NRRL 8057 = DSM 46488]